MNGKRLFIATIIAWTLATPASAYPRQVERWRPILDAELRRQHVHSAYIENRIMRIINGESTGNPKAGHVNGCYGLVQADRGWIRTKVPWYHRGHDWRGDGKASIWVIVTLYRKYGVAPLRRHWQATF